MTAIALPLRPSWTRRLALRAGRALTAWAARPRPRTPDYAERVARIERSRDSLTRLQLPR